MLPIDSCNESAQKRQVQIFANIQIICFRLIWLKVLNTKLVEYMELSAVSINFCTFYELEDETTIVLISFRFRNECPDGKLTKQHLKTLFEKVFPDGEI